MRGRPVKLCRVTRRLTFLLVFALLTSVACFGGDDEPASSGTAVAIATVTPVPEVSPSATAAPPTPTPEPDLLSAVWLFDIESGERVTLFEDAERRVVAVTRFDGETVTVRDRSASTGSRYDLEGNAVSEPTPAATTHLRCNETPDGAEVEGRVYAGAGCGLISPDQRWMLYEVDAGEVQLSGSGFQGTFPVWDQWAVDLQTGETRLLQEGLVHCGGCDGRFGPDWSVSGRFVYFSELISDGRTLVHDFDTAETRVLAEASTEIGSKPEWSPIDDLLLHPGPDGEAALADLRVGVTLVLPGIRWPARFDDSGRYLYGSGGEEQTVVYDLEAKAVAATLTGTAWLERPYGRSQRVRAVDDTFVALLDWGSACEGASVYRGPDRVACVEASEPDPYGHGGLGERLRTVLSPGGEWAAVARLVEIGEAPPCTENPCGQATIEALYQDPSYNPAWRVSRYEVLLIDTETGDTTLLSDQTFSPSPPQLLWHDDGTHLLVSWPYESGPGP